MSRPEDSYLYALAAALANEGNRVCGQPAIRAARRRLADLWRSYGATLVREEEVDTSVTLSAGVDVWWLNAPPNLAGLDGQGVVERLPCFPSKSGTVEGEVIDLRQGAVARPGMIGILPPELVQTGAMADWHAAGLAGGLIPSVELPDAAQLTYLYREAGFPVVGITRLLADRLGATRGARVKIDSGSWVEPTTCANLVTEFGPADAPEFLVLGAHLDSHITSPGVFDNLSGVLAMCGVLQGLAAGSARWRRRLVVIAYTGEEVGWAGSLAYVAQHHAELPACRLAVNFDSLAHCTARGIAVIGAPGWVEPLRALAPTADVRDFFCYGSDYLPWLLEGIPALRPATFGERLPPWTHTTRDTMANYDGSAIAANVATWAPLLEALLTAPALPNSPRRSPAVVRAEFAAKGALENLAWRLPITPLGAAAAARLNLP